ncbi:MAG: hypothetical protein IKW90_16825 [Lachnospiraceae bacterium]|nr:hypothetical protein [Lachnospiraceae bacterium]
MKDRIVLSMSEEKQSALEMYLAQKSTSLAAEIDKFTEQLYAKTVPQNVREYIELTSDSKPVRKPRPPRSSDGRSPSGQ